MRDLEPRGQHYLFAHKILRSRFLGNPEAVMNQLQEGGVTLLRSLWDRAGFDPSIKEMVREHFTPGAPKKHLVEPDGLGCQIEKLPDGVTIALVTMPAPRAMTEAYFVAAIQGPTVRRYITLEYTTAHPLGAVLCEWIGDNHANTGKGLEPKLAVFRGAVIGLLNRNEQGTQPGAGPPQAPSRNEQAISDSGANDSSQSARGEAGGRADRIPGVAEKGRPNMKCAKCGKQWPADAKFCGVCGSGLAGADPQAAEKKDLGATVLAEPRPPTPRKDPLEILRGLKGSRPENRPQESAPGGFSEQIKALADRAGFKIESVKGDVVRARFSVKDGRTQLVIFKYAGDLAGKPVVRINSPVANLTTHPLNNEAAIRLLRQAGTLKLGGFAIDEGHLVVHQGMILSHLSPEELRDTVMILAVFADNVEKDITGKDVY